VAAEGGVFLHMLSYRDGYYWKPNERRESGEDKREFEEENKVGVGLAGV
jgi:hypothetical protein